MSEANETEVKVIPPAQTQYVKAKNETLTDLASFNAYGFVTLSDGQVVGIQTTGRHGISADDMYKDFQQFVTFLDLCAIDHAVKFVEKRNGTYPSEAQAKPAENKATADNGSAPAAPAKKERKWDEPVPQAELPAELAEVTVDVFTQEFDWFEVSPKPDGKASIQFHKDKLEYAVGFINNWKHDTIKQALATLTEKQIDPAVPDKYRIAGTMFWKKGNEYTNKKGEKSNYKDVILLKPAF